MSELDEYDAAVKAEWGVYVASEVIYIGGARAFNVGDPVPAGHIDRGVVNAEQVAKTSTKTGKALAGTDETPKG